MYVGSIPTMGLCLAAAGQRIAGAKWEDCPLSHTCHISYSINPFGAELIKTMACTLFRLLHFQTLQINLILSKNICQVSSKLERDERIVIMRLIKI